MDEPLHVRGLLLGPDVDTRAEVLLDGNEEVCLVVGHDVLVEGRPLVCLGVGVSLVGLCVGDRFLCVWGLGVTLVCVDRRFWVDF